MIHKIINNKKAGISLTTSYIVIIIIVLALIGIAIRLVTIGLDQANNGKGIIDDAHKQQIEKHYQLSTSKTFLPYDHHTLNSGGTHTFAMGLKNIIGRKTTFNIQLIYSDAHDLAGDKMLDPVNIDEWYFLDPIEVNLDANEYRIVGLTIKAKGARPGEYKFNVLVTCNLNSCDPYYDVKSLTLNVE